MSWILKGCPRCSGDLHKSPEYYNGSYYPVERCLQCGYENGGPVASRRMTGGKGFARHKKFLIKS